MIWNHRAKGKESVSPLKMFMIQFLCWALRQGCQTQIHSRSELSSEVKSRARFNIY